MNQVGDADEVGDEGGGRLLVHFGGRADLVDAAGADFDTAALAGLLRPFFPSQSSSSGGFNVNLGQ